jgi:hypothetical protein
MRASSSGTLRRSASVSARVSSATEGALEPGQSGRQRRANGNGLMRERKLWRGSQAPSTQLAKTFEEAVGGMSSGNGGQRREFLTRDSGERRRAVTSRTAPRSHARSHSEEPLRVETKRRSEEALRVILRPSASTPRKSQEASGSKSEDLPEVVPESPGETPRISEKPVGTSKPLFSLSRKDAT